MPNIKWEEINDVIHQCKSTLQLAYALEHLSVNIRKKLGKELEKIEDIINRQVEVTKNDEKMDKSN